MKKKILVTGGAGFIGSNFIRYLFSAYPKLSLVNLDKLTYAGRGANLGDLAASPRYRFVKGDICDQQAVSQAMRGCEIVINFAAESHVDRSIVDPAQFVRTNVFGAHVLLEQARKNKISLFCQISTDEVYGSRMSGSFKETDRLEPSSPYSATKAAADHLALSYFITYKLPVVIVRPTNNFGPYQFPEKVIPLFVTNILKDKKVPLYGDGLNVRDWLYVQDCCRAIDIVINRGRPGEIYNIAGKNEIKNIELTRLILKMMDKPKNYISFVADRPGHDRRYSLDPAKLARLGWRSRVAFTRALGETIQWYVNNQKWWKRLKG
ncbi:MAG: dTDP-glucose 4,6-dehydratase [Candidatus Omnitrophota bacterium]